ncbi:hypothetical protein FEE59_15750 [Herbaspirillum sp. RU 5E]|nr:hypothetical protein [Herbaspirillum sp. RU 5E]
MPVKAHEAQSAQRAPREMILNNINSWAIFPSRCTDFPQAGACPNTEHARNRCNSHRLSNICILLVHFDEIAPKQCIQVRALHRAQRPNWRDLPKNFLYWRTRKVGGMESAIIRD